MGAPYRNCWCGQDIKSMAAENLSSFERAVHARLDTRVYLLGDEGLGRAVYNRHEQGRHHHVHTRHATEYKGNSELLRQAKNRKSRHPILNVVQERQTFLE
ncbi:hypothetical protein BaRGS_00019124 [Batillaria attramentaria]|uniref:Uncharacterized protein n=1 Tax=Batillaria attramentaria TaxID=370345 RepID=A0ABD0KS67_9CAEN